MKIVRLFIFSFSVFIIAGCLTYSKVIYEIEFDEKFESGWIQVSYINIQSSEENTEKQNSDFDELIQMLEGDSFLLDTMEEGIYIQNRTLVESDAKLNASYTGIFRKLKFDSQELKTSKNERTLTIEKEEGDILESNGKIMESNDSYLISWPKDQRKLRFSISKNFDDKTYSLLDYYQKYKNEN